MAKKRKAAAKRVAPRKPARKRRAGSPDATINTLVILVVIVMVLGGLFLYAQNKKQAALWPDLLQAIASVTGLPIALQSTALPQTIQPAAGTETPRTAEAAAPPPPAIAIIRKPGQSD
jgi:hypothetical protein